MTPYQMNPDADMAPILALIRESFVYMEARIDPPSSMHLLTEASIARQAEDGEVWVIGDVAAPEACVFLTPQSDALYVGKLAVATEARGKGHARRLMALAQERAKARNRSLLRLQARIELTENHAFFRRLGFTKVAVTAHPGFTRPTSITFEKALVPSSF